MEADFLKVFLAGLAAISFAFNIFQYVRASSRFTLQIHHSQEANKDGVGVYLAGVLFVSNTGKSPAYFSGVTITQENGDYYYPVIGLDGGTKIEPGQTVQGAIPVEHLLGNQAKELIVFDGVWKEYKIKKRCFRKFLQELAAEAARLESVGVSIHPNSSGGV